MPIPRGRFRPLIALAFASCLASSHPAFGQDDPVPPADNPHAGGTYRGANACFRCHVQPLQIDYDNGALDWSLLTEVSTWRTVDKHSMAYAVLEGPRGREMGEKLGVDVTKPESGCLSCHAQNFPDQQLGSEFSYKDGVNCEVCHGPAGDWIGDHSEKSRWRVKTPSEKAALGMWDLRNPEVQSEVCLSCHVGDAGLGRVVSHPMYAAGHPPLPSVDVARFVKNIPQHWRDKDQIPWWKDAPEAIREANGYAPDKLFEAELTMVGNIVALRESMELLAERADIGSASKEGLPHWPELALNQSVRDDPRFEQPGEFPSLALNRWPEMAMTHSDCLACHHDLRYPGWRQRRGFVAAPGRPMPRSFPLALIDLNLEQFGEEGDRTDFEERLDRLYAAFADRPFGRPDKVRDAAKGLAEWADRFHSKRLESARFDVDDGPVLLRTLCELNRGTVPDYDTARQIASAIQVIYREWHGRVGEGGTGHDRIEAILEVWDEGLNLGRYPKSEERDALSLKLLRGLANEPDLEGIAGWTPKALGYPDDPSKYWEATENNPFLDALRRINPDRMRDAYVSGEFREPLQEINNSGLRIALDLASQYDPYRFQAQLEELCSLLPPSGSQ